MDQSHNNLSNVEILILQLIEEHVSISGYQIKKTVKTRQYDNTFNIGPTSIYNALKKLENKNLAKSKLTKKKQGKGPSPIKFSITETGSSMLQKTIISLLSTTRERDVRFDIGLLGIPHCEKTEIIKALNQRRIFLSTRQEDITNNYIKQNADELPLQRRAIIKHPLLFIDGEILFIERLIKAISKNS